MSKGRGKFTKKILHIGHVLLEFLRHVLKAFGRPKSGAGTHAKSMAETTGKNVGDKVSGKAAAGASKSAASKSAALGSKAGASSLSAGSAGASSTTLTGLAGSIICIKTLAVVLVASSLFLGGLGTYSYVNHQNPLNVLGDLLGNSGGHQNNSAPTNNHNPTNPANQNTNTPAALTLTPSTTPTSNPVQSSDQSNNQPSSSKNSNTSTNTSYDARYDNGTTPPSFNYTVPGNPDNPLNNTLGLIMPILIIQFH